MKQRHAQLGLQIADLARDARLGYAERLGRVREVERLADRGKALDLIEVHRAPRYPKSPYSLLSYNDFA